MQAPFVAEPAGDGDRPDGRLRTRSSTEHRDQITRILGAEEERFAETLERGMKLFEEAAAGGAISGEDAFDAAGDLRLPDRADARARPRARHRGRRGLRTRAEMDRHREISRAGGRQGRGPAGRRLRARGGLHHRVRRLGEDRGAHPDRRARGARRRPLPGEAARVALLRGGRRPGHRRRRAPEGRRLAGDAARRLPDRGRPGAALRGGGLRGRRPGQGGRPVECPLPDDGQPHGHPSPARGAAGGARRARPPGRLGGAAGQAPLRLQSPAGAHRRGARGGRAARQRSASSRTTRCGRSSCRSTRHGTSAR